MESQCIFEFEDILQENSVSGEMPVLLRHKHSHKVEIMQLKDITYAFTDCEGEGLERSTCTHLNYYIWSGVGWTEIIALYRRLATQPLKRIFTSKGMIDVAIDHSLLESSGESVKVKDCKAGRTSLMHHLPESATGLEYLPVHQALIEDIAEKEVSILGLFFAAGQCNNMAVYIQEPKNFWSIKHVNDILLREIQETLERLYHCTGLFIIHKLFQENGQSLYKLQIEYANSIVAMSIIKKYMRIFYRNGEPCLGSEVLNLPLHLKRLFLKSYLIGYYNISDFKTVDRVECPNMVTAHAMYYLLKETGINVNIKLARGGGIILKLANRIPRAGDYVISRVQTIHPREQTYLYDMETASHCLCAGVGEIVTHDMAV